MTLPFISMRFRIAALLSLVVLSITALDAWLVPERAADAERSALTQRVRAVAAMLASSSVAALEFEQVDAARRALTAAQADPLVRWAAIYGPDGALVTQVGEGARRRANVRGQDAQIELDDDSGRMIAWLVPIKQGDRLLGAVGVGMVSTAVARRRSETRGVILMQGAVVAALGIMLSLALSTRMTRSLTSITRAAGEIGRGNVSGELRVSDTRDELGEMARAFQAMQSRLRELEQLATRVADGDLRVTIEGDGELTVAFRRMLESLRGLTGRIGSSSASVSTAAAGMFSAVREQETFAMQQTASLEEIRKTLETLANAADTVTSDAQAVRDMSSRTLDSSQRMADHTRLVSAHSDRIGEILSLIQDIADRSDLLALNAALEGTRAGEVGRGFSLVAAEMRRLSEHVMDSVRDIRKLVADMRGASHALVLATEESTKLARDAATAAEKIEGAARRQQEGTGQAKSAADEIVRVVNELLSGSANTTKSAESLLQLAHEQKRTLEAFRTDRG